MTIYICMIGTYLHSGSYFVKPSTSSVRSLELGERERRTVRKFAGLRELGLDLEHAPVTFELPPPVVVAAPVVQEQV